MSGQRAIVPRAVVVDELPLARAGLAALLAGLGLEVIAETHSGREAATVAQLEQPDLVVVGAPADLTLVDTVRRLMQLRPRPTVVALLSPGSDADVRYVVALGVAGIALRPASTDDLATVVTHALKGEQYVVPALHGALASGLEPLRPSADGDGAVVLSSREREVLGLLAAGRSNSEIATELSISPSTVKSHLVRMYAKLEASNRREALGRAVALGLVR
jgi:DNA-binding NarL/FixJ family response regulator